MARAGDLILWDSRTVHGGKVGTGLPVPADLAGAAVSLPRLTQTVYVGARAHPFSALCLLCLSTITLRSLPSVVVVVAALYSCMTPRARASAEVLTARREGFARGAGFTHVPHEGHVSKKGPAGFQQTVVLTAEQAALL